MNPGRNAPLSRLPRGWFLAEMLAYIILTATILGTLGAYAFRLYVLLGREAAQEAREEIWARLAAKVRDDFRKARSVALAAPDPQTPLVFQMTLQRDDGSTVILEGRPSGLRRRILQNGQEMGFFDFTSPLLSFSLRYASGGSPERIWELIPLPANGNPVNLDGRALYLQAGFSFREVGGGQTQKIIGGAARMEALPKR